MLCAAALVLVACEPQAETTDTDAEQTVRLVEAIRVGDADQIARRFLPGRAQAHQELIVSFRVPGRLVSFPVSVGDQIQQNGLIGQLDQDTFVAEVERLIATSERAAATLTNARLHRQRQQTLVERGHVAQSVLDEAVAREREASADLAASRAALARAELDLDYTTLQAPFSGTVVATYIENFEEIRAQQPVLRLLDTTRMEFVVDVPETLISLVPFSHNFRVRLDLLPDVELPAEVHEIGSEASRTTRTYPVTLIMDQPASFRILPGMAGQATADPPAGTDGFTGLLEIPAGAIFSSGDEQQTFVWVIEEPSMTLVRRDVEVGLAGPTGFYIENGLERGDWILTAGVHSVSEGQRVRVLGQEAEAAE